MIKGAFSGLIQFLAIERSFLLHLKSSFCSQDIQIFVLNVWSCNVNLKFYDVTVWLANNCGTHIGQYLES